MWNLRFKVIIFSLAFGCLRPALTHGVDFNSDVRPILSNHCVQCHGPDEHDRQADLRLDVTDDDFDVFEGGAESEFVARITSDDSDSIMPPPDLHKPLKPEQVALLKEWAIAGAPYEVHWSYKPLVHRSSPKLPSERLDSKSENLIDPLVRQKLEQNGLRASPRADRVTLARRLYVDLLGLPPTPEQIAEFVNDRDEDAYEQLVKRLLDDPHFGERMAVFWLDLVRYADTIGYHSDTFMEMSAYRDWVIDAFNANKPFDDFTIEQLAGDLLPNATQQQKIASGYNRLLQTTEEGGAQAAEYLTIYSADRVRNVSLVWMGSTLGCAQCHDHKYDPFTAKDFYSMAAFFADIKEKPLGKREPNLKLPTEEQAAEIERLRQKIAEHQVDVLVANDGSFLERLRIGQSKWEMEQFRKELSSISPWSLVLLPTDVLQTLFTAAADRTEQQVKVLESHYRSVAPELKASRKEIAAAEKRIGEIEAKTRTMLVSESLETPRVTRVLARGDWMDKSGEIVDPAVPDFLPHDVIQGRRATRLDLANWIVGKANPLTSRTFVNRLWAMFYGNGLSPNLDDLGGQGEPPTHLELLDELAIEFRESGWDVKKMVSQMVTSETYQQSSVADSELKAIDSGNRLLARQGRWRIDAEFVRDVALKLSGLLQDDMRGGVSVKPYQPAGYWQHLNFPQRTWKADDRDKLYRRGLYTFWCRSFLHPSMLAFDAPSREECTAKRARSNIPQQALVLLNDPIYLEASRVFAERIARIDGDPGVKIAWAWEQAVSRQPTDHEATLLLQLFQNQQERYADRLDDAKKLLAVGSSPIAEDVSQPELAAWTQVARAIFNAYETTSRF